MSDSPNILFYGYGNPGRGDDGLGPALVAALESLISTGLDCESAYQLSVEEYLTWKHGIDLFGLAGLRLDGAQKRRKALAPSTD